MNKQLSIPTNSPFIKVPFGGLTANTLRSLAVLFMLTDHIWATYMSFGNWMTYVGRMAFPIFAFQITEGFAHTKNLKKYVLRLLAFALISEVPFDLFCSSRWFNPYHQNVLFTFLLGIAAIKVIDGVRKNHNLKNVAVSGLWLFVIIIASVIGFVDYGFLGVLTVVLFYAFRDFPFAWALQFLGMVAVNVIFFEGQVIPVEIAGLALEIPVQSFAVFSLIPIWLYKGRKGVSNKVLQYGFYAFYPLHMVILFMIKYFA